MNAQRSSGLDPSKVSGTWMRDWLGGGGFGGWAWPCSGRLLTAPVLVVEPGRWCSSTLASRAAGSVEGYGVCVRSVMGVGGQFAVPQGPLLLALPPPMDQH